MVRSRYSALLTGKPPTDLPHIYIPMKMLKTVSVALPRSKLGLGTAMLALWAVNVHPAMGAADPHSGLAFMTVTTTYELKDTKGRVVTVKWQPRSLPGTDAYTHEYDITVTIPAKATYSLLTLGLQSWDQPRTLTCTSGNSNLRYSSHETEAHHPMNSKEPVGRFNRDQNGQADIKAYSTFTFNRAGTYKFELTEVPPSGRKTKWHNDAPKHNPPSGSQGKAFFEHENDPPKNPPD
jgi:hypothetical protein